MTLSLPTYRNSFHPAWLLLVVVPAMGLGMVTWNFDGESLVAFLGQSVLAALVVGPMVLWRNGEAPPWAPRWMKEMRGVLVPLLVSVGAPEVFGILRLLSPTVDPGEATGNWMATACVLGALVAGATTFGEEFEHRTFGALLSQPRSRRTLYLEKLASLALVLVWSGANLGLALAGFGNFAYGGESSQMVIGWGLLAVIFCTTPLYTLLTRSTLAGAIFTAAVPLLAALMGILVVEFVEWRTGNRPDPEAARWILYASPAYLAVTAWMGWRAFRGMQVNEGAGGAGPALHHPLSIPVDRVLGGLLPRGAFGQLLRKEARLHMVPWLVAGMMVACWAVALGVRWLRIRDTDASSAFDFGAVGVLFAIMGLLTLLVSGAACVAEERGLGTLEWQLTQPASVTRQWWIKILVAGGHFLLLGVLLPFGLFVGLAGWQTVLSEPDLGALLRAVVVAGAAVFVFSIAVYASSFSRSTMKAAAATVGIAALMALVPIPFAAWVGVRMDHLSTEFESGPVSAPAFEPGRELVAVAGSILVGLLVVGVFVLLMVQGRRNFARAHVSGSQVVRQLLLVLLLLVPGLLVTSGVFLQVARWELQANFFRMQQARMGRARTALHSLIDWQVAHNAVNADFLRRVGLRAVASPAELQGALEGIQDPEDVEQWVRILTVDVLRSAGIPIHSEVGEDANALLHYGLPLDRLIEKRIREESAKTNAAAAPATGSRFFRMDPVLARRYGLLPKEGNPPAPPSPSQAAPPP
ncbi:MAG: hypothetical protein JNL10_02085 [Verrucomicrobiales bacterium]|nr:hypothetical protein [Verrucomicrobiales bacterium]